MPQQPLRRKTRAKRKGAFRQPFLLSGRPIGSVFNLSATTAVLKAKAMPIRFASRSKRLLQILLTLGFLPSAAFSGTAGPDGLTARSACELEPGGESTVVAIGGPRSLHLADGRLIYLAEVMPPNHAEEAALALPSSATAYLRTYVLGRKVEIKFGGKHQDRYGATVAHIFVAGEHALWVQESLVSEGLALAFPQPDNHACSQQLMSIEEKARDENRGYWGLALFKVLQAQESRSILNHMQTYQIIEGVISSIAFTASGRADLHFADGGKFAFTATVEPTAAKKLDLDNWQGQNVRIRGWVERKRGPAITIIQPEQIKLLQRQAEPSPLTRENLSDER